jgi:hypothetical protein
MNNLCVTSQLDDLLMSSAQATDGPQNQAGVFNRRDSRLSSNDKNYNMISHRLSLKN